MCGVVECTVPKGVGLFEAAPDENQCRAGDFLFLDLLPDRFQCRVDIGLVGPAHTVGHDDRAVGTIERNEVAFDLAQVADRKMDGKRRTRASEACQSSPGGIAEDFIAVRVRIRVCVTSGTVSSMPRPAAAAA